MFGVEWVLFIVVVFAAGAVLRGPHKRSRRGWGPAPGQAASPPAPRPGRAVRQAVPRMSELAMGRLPVDYQVKVDTIRRKVDWMLNEYGDRFPAGSRERHLVESTATEYLPDTLAAYYKLPPGYAQWPVRGDGKTGLQVLWEQLDTMDRRLDEIAQEVERRDVDHLLVNGRFLDQRFGRPRVRKGSDTVD